jgi:hypothetical protein
MAELVHDPLEPLVRGSGGSFSNAPYKLSISGQNRDFPAVILGEPKSRGAAGK